MANDPSKSADVVMVACKLPHGLILELITPSATMQPAPAGERVVLAGANSLREDKRAAQGHHPFALTPVPKALWEEWLKRNKDMDFVKRGLVFAQPSVASAKDKAKEMDKERTGMEALATDKDPRVVQAGKLNGMNVETDADALSRTQAAVGNPL